MSHFARLACSALLIWCYGAQAEERPKGLNCDLTQPPAASGEEQNHGTTLRISPRAKDIGHSYSGCQILFAPDSSGWAVVSITEVKEGDAVRIWSEYEADPRRLACRYKQGTLVKGDTDACPAPQFILVRSMAPGCVKVNGDLVAKQGLGAKWPKQCEYD